MKEFGRQISRFGQKKQTDLCDMRAGCDVNEIIFLIRLKAVAGREIMQCAVHILKVPGVVKMSFPRTDPGFRTDRRNVLADELAKLAELRLKQQLKAIDQQVLMLAE